MTADALQPPAFPPAIERARWLSPIIGAGALVLCVVAWIFTPNTFYPAYLCAWLFWLAVSLGGLSVVMLNHLAGGAWGVLVRRFGEAASNVLPLLLVLFIPVIVGSRVLYPWRAGNPEHDNPFVMHRAGYYQFWFWILRVFVYFALWTGLAFFLRRLSLSHDRSPRPRLAGLMRRLSAGGMVVYFVIMSLAAIDWIMSREPNWRSTMFGFIICMGQATAGFSFLIIMLALFKPTAPFRGRVSPDHFNDLGNLLLTCVILWSYMAFGQLLIVWLGNMQGEIVWYVPRTRAGWHVLAAILIIFHFIVPFILLLMRSIKRNPTVMIALCAELLIMRWLDLAWITLPSGGEANAPRPIVVILLSFLAVVGIGGLWVAMFLWLLGRAPLLPVEEVRSTLAPGVQVDVRKEYDRPVGPQPGGAVA